MNIGIRPPFFPLAPDFRQQRADQVPVARSLDRASRGGFKGVLSFKTHVNRSVSHGGSDLKVRSGEGLPSGHSSSLWPRESGWEAHWEAHIAFPYPLTTALGSSARAIRVDFGSSVPVGEEKPR